jgi:hypothetical protein
MAKLNAASTPNLVSQSIAADDNTKPLPTPPALRGAHDHRTTVALIHFPSASCTELQMFLL